MKAMALVLSLALFSMSSSVAALAKSPVPFQDLGLDFGGKPGKISNVCLLKTAFTKDLKSYPANLRRSFASCEGSRGFRFVKQELTDFAKPSGQAIAALAPILDKIEKGSIKLSEETRRILKNWDQKHKHDFEGAIARTKEFDDCHAPARYAGNFVNIISLTEHLRLYLASALPATKGDASLGERLAKRGENYFYALDRLTECFETGVANIVSLSLRTEAFDLVTGLAQAGRVSPKIQKKFLGLYRGEDYHRSQGKDMIRSEFWLHYYLPTTWLAERFERAQEIYESKFPKASTPVYDEELVMNWGRRCHGEMIESLEEGRKRKKGACAEAPKAVAQLKKNKSEAGWKKLHGVNQKHSPALSWYWIEYIGGLQNVKLNREIETLSKAVDNLKKVSTSKEG